jgi:hypothetical protein
MELGYFYNAAPARQTSTLVAISALSSTRSADFPQAATVRLLLCSTHQSLLDAGFIAITRSGLVAYSDPNGEDGPYSPADKALTLALHGKPASIPRSKQHRPADRALARHHKIHKWGDLP